MAADAFYAIGTQEDIFFGSYAKYIITQNKKLSKNLLSVLYSFSNSNFKPVFLFRNGLLLSMIFPTVREEKNLNRETFNIQQVGGYYK